jgi:Protein of unknown function (DUF3137)
MKSAEQFQAFYQSSLSTVVADLETTRKGLVKKVYIAGAAALAFIVLSSVFGEVTTVQDSDGLESSSGGIISVLGYIILAGAIGYFFWFRPKNRDFKSRFKAEVVNRIVKFIDESLTYDPTGGIARSEFEQSTIFDWAGHRYLSEDLVSGKIGQTSVRFSEVHTQRKHEMGGDDDGGGKFHRWVTLFKGVIFIADFNKHFKGRTMVLTDQFFKKNMVKRDPVVKMENPDFEKAFAVHSSDPVEAHYILTPSLMERMMGLHAKASNVQFAFFQSVVFISLPMKKNLFEANIFSSLGGRSEIEKYLGQLQQFTCMVEELNLNTRIWTKE